MRYAVIVLLCAVGCGRAGSRQTAPPKEDPVGWKIRDVKLKIPPDEFLLRGNCELSTEYLGIYRVSRQLAYSIRISQDDPPDHMFVYLDRSDPQAERIYSLLSTGPKPMTFVVLLTQNFDVGQIRKVVTVE